METRFAVKGKSETERGRMGFSESRPHRYCSVTTGDEAAERIPSGVSALWAATASFCG